MDRGAPVKPRDARRLAPVKGQAGLLAKKIERKQPTNTETLQRHTARSNLLLSCLRKAIIEQMAPTKLGNAPAHRKNQPERNNNRSRTWGRTAWGKTWKQLCAELKEITTAPIRERNRASLDNIRVMRGVFQRSSLLTSSKDLLDSHGGNVGQGCPRTSDK